MKRRDLFKAGAALAVAAVLPAAPSPILALESSAPCAVPPEVIEELIRRIAWALAMPIDMLRGDITKLEITLRTKPVITDLVVTGTVSV